MVTFKGEPNLLVRFNPPIGPLKYVRFDENGEYTTDNERVIRRFHHKFDSVPAKGKELTPDQGDDLEILPHNPAIKCKHCEFSTDNKGLLMQHYKDVHPKPKKPKEG